MPESPRYAYRLGREEEARETMARLHGVGPYSPRVDFELMDIEAKIQKENADGHHSWYEILTGPRMMYRTLLGIVLQAGQQLTGANFFFYYGTTIFRSTGIADSYITSIILGSVNMGATIGGLWVVKNCGRRKSMMVGAASMCICFLIYSLVGHFALSPSNPLSTPRAGVALIVFTCLFIVAFATTWGPMVWAIVGELYPARYRARCMALATASNWFFNFLISFFTTFITNKIDYFYGLVFAGCCFALFWVVFFFMIEGKDRSLEEIETMYLLGVNPRASAKWKDDDSRSQNPEEHARHRAFVMSGGNGGDARAKRPKCENSVLVRDQRRFPDNP